MATYCIRRTWDDQPITTDEQVQIHLTTLDEGIQVVIDAPYHNDPAPTHPSGSCWKLWEHEVVEIFLVGRNGQYTEFEFGPHGHYLILRLDAPRSVLDQEHTISYTSTINGDRWFGKTLLPNHLLPSDIHRFNLFAIHGEHAQRRYLCYGPLPDSHPDFHQPDRFPHYHR